METGQIGDTLGGITAPFLSFFGSILVYLALRSQIDANEEFKIQFKKQSEEATYYRLLDNQRVKTLNYSIQENSIGSMFGGAKQSYKEYKGHEFIHYLVKSFQNGLTRKTEDFSKYLIAKYPNEINIQYYDKLLDIKRSEHPNCEDKPRELKQLFINTNSEKDRWDYFKNYNGYQASYVREAFQYIGLGYWYNVAFSHKRAFYIKVYETFYNKYAGFLEGFINDIKNICSYIDLIEKNDFYVNYFKNYLTTQEKIIIFYYATTLSSDDPFLRKIEKFKLLDDLITKRNLFIGSPSENQFVNELKQLFYSPIIYQNFKESVKK